MGFRENAIKVVANILGVDAQFGKAAPSTPSSGAQGQSVQTANQLPAEWLTSTYAPGWPIEPIERPEDALVPREIDYPIAVNATLQPRTAYGLMPFAALKEAYESVTEIRLPVSTLLREMLIFRPHLIDKNGGEIDGHDFDWLTISPDRATSFDVWITRFLKSALIFDAGAFHYGYDHGKLERVRYIDGSTLFLMVDELGQVPEPTQTSDDKEVLKRYLTKAKQWMEKGKKIPATTPAYAQVIKGTPFGWYDKNQIWYRPRSRRFDAPYGETPIEQAWPWVLICANITGFELAHYREGNMPEGWVNAPEGWTLERIAAFEEAFNKRMSSGPSERMRSRWLPAGSEWHETKKQLFPQQLYDQAAHNVSLLFGVPPSEYGKVPGEGLGGSGFEEAMQSTLFRMGLFPLKTYIESAFNEILEKAGVEDATFELAFPKDQVDPDKHKQSIVDMFSNGLMTYNSALSQLGQDSIGPEGDVHILIQGGTVTILEDVLKQAQKNGGQVVMNPNDPRNKKPGQQPPDDDGGNNGDDGGKDNPAPKPGEGERTEPMTDEDKKIAEKLLRNRNLDLLNRFISVPSTVKVHGNDFDKGGAGSGNFGHAGRAGVRGGSGGGNLGGGIDTEYARNVDVIAPKPEYFAKGETSNFIITPKGDFYEAKKGHDNAATSLGFKGVDEMIQDGGTRIAYVQTHRGMETILETQKIDTPTLRHFQKLYDDGKVDIPNGDVYWGAGYGGEVTTKYLSSDEFLSATKVVRTDRGVVIKLLKDDIRAVAKHPRTPIHGGHFAPKGHNKLPMGEAKRIAEELGVEFSSISLDEFKRAVEEEADEHPEVIRGNMGIAGMIVRDHLEEDPKYYTEKFAKMADDPAGMLESVTIPIKEFVALVEHEKEIAPGLDDDEAEDRVLHSLSMAKGGAGSGNFGHSGRVGVRGGSGGGGMLGGGTRLVNGALPSNQTFFHYTQPQYGSAIREGGFVVKPDAISPPLLGSGVYFTDDTGQAEYSKYGADRVEAQVEVKKTLEVNGVLEYAEWLENNKGELDDHDPSTILRAKGYDSLLVNKKGGNIIMVVNPANIKVTKMLKGGAGSGNFGHAGRVGVRGGSGGGGIAGGVLARTPGGYESGVAIQVDKIVDVQGNDMGKHSEYIIAPDGKMYFAPEGHYNAIEDITGERKDAGQYGEEKAKRKFMMDGGTRIVHSVVFGHKSTEIETGNGDVATLRRLQRLYDNDKIDLPGEGVMWSSASDNRSWQGTVSEFLSAKKVKPDPGYEFGLVLKSLTKADAQHDGIMVALDIPDDVAKRLQAACKAVLPTGVEAEPIDEMHVTLFYPGSVDEVDFNQSQMIGAVKEFCRTHAPLVGVIGGVARFNPPLKKGGAGSGNFGHSGRAGVRGGSGGGGIVGGGASREMENGIGTIPGSWKQRTLADNGKEYHFYEVPGDAKAIKDFDDSAIMVAHAGENKGSILASDGRMYHEAMLEDFDTEDNIDNWTRMYWDGETEQVRADVGFAGVDINPAMPSLKSINRAKMNINYARTTLRDAGLKADWDIFEDYDTENIEKRYGKFDKPMSPLVALFDCPDLPQFRQDLVEHLHKSGIHENIDELHGFTPHITLAYVPADTELPEVRVDPLPLTFKDITVAWAGNWHHIPLQATRNIQKMKIPELAKHCGVCVDDDAYYGAPVLREAKFVYPDDHHVNDIEVVAMAPEGLEARPAIWKPEGGEVDSLQTKVGGPLYPREEASYLLDRSMGFYLIPVSYVAEAGEEMGAAIHYMMNAPRSKPVDEFDFAWVEKAGVLDYVCGQVDRHTGNYLVHPDDDKRPVLIDNGLAFPAEDIKTYSPFVDAVRGKPISQETMRALQICHADMATWADVRRLLGEEAANKAMERLWEIISNGKLATRDENGKLIEPTATEDATEVFEEQKKVAKGGAGSGNFGHAGRQGVRGGSGGGGVGFAGGAINEKMFSTAMQNLYPQYSGMLDMTSSERAEYLAVNYNALAKSLGLKTPIEVSEDVEFNKMAAKPARELGVSRRQITGLHVTDSNGGNGVIYMRKSVLEGSFGNEENSIYDAHDATFHEIGHAYECETTGAGLEEANSLDEYMTDAHEVFARNFADALHESYISKGSAPLKDFLEPK